MKMCADLAMPMLTHTVGIHAKVLKILFRVGLNHV